ncbi:hypothetical protein MSG28_007812 [Choristoneura fumiferana]|uniref:Uncharacterized protein n=1 Tax=Choristoneura fumiferana TaxID=7141 RepID=A0ACC0JZ88_CHOFU|nr:hypothetical protein MSG28_007812 [Choristoneura fumiferana]
MESGSCCLTIRKKEERKNNGFLTILKIPLLELNGETDKGVGDYENRFLTPMSHGVWWCSAAAGVVCALVLVAAAATEGRPEPGSVVSWLLNAAAPTLNSLDGLIKSDFELIFEDIGYTRGWLAKEDELRLKKVTNARRTVPLLLSVEEGIELVRTGRYAYHTEPYTASQAISRTFVDKELCALGGLQVITPAPVYIMGQKRSPYKQFFVWSMMRLLERGHVKATRARVGGNVPPCSGRNPRALSLGQSAPAFLLLAEAMMLAVLMLAAEILWHRYLQIL